MLETRVMAGLSHVSVVVPLLPPPTVALTDVLTGPVLGVIETDALPVAFTRLDCWAIIIIATRAIAAISMIRLSFGLSLFRLVSLILLVKISRIVLKQSQDTYTPTDKSHVQLVRTKGPCSNTTPKQGNECQALALC